MHLPHRPERLHAQGSHDEDGDRQRGEQEVGAEGTAPVTVAELADSTQPNAAASSPPPTMAKAGTKSPAMTAALPTRCTVPSRDVNPEVAAIQHAKPSELVQASQADLGPGQPGGRGRQRLKNSKTVRTMAAAITQAPSVSLYHALSALPLLFKMRGPAEPSEFDHAGTGCAQRSHS